MLILFKILGAFLGYRFAGGQGAVFGVIVGHALDSGLNMKIRQAKAKKIHKRQAMVEENKVFLVSLFSMIAKLSLADGGLTEEERHSVFELMKDHFSFNRRQIKLATKIFSEALNNGTSFQLYAAQFYEQFRHQPEVLEGTIEILLRIAASDGELNDAEEKVIREAAVFFKLRKDVYRQFLSRYRKTAEILSRVDTDIDRCYEVLGCKASDPDKVVKKQYRKLVSDYHPDKIVSKDLPDGFIDFANQKFKEVQAAWEAVKHERKLA